MRQIERSEDKDVPLAEDDVYDPSCHPLTPDNLRQLKMLGTRRWQSFFMFHLEYQPFWVQVLRLQLIQAIDMREISMAEAYLQQISALDGMDTPVNQQFIKTQEIKFMQLRKVALPDIKTAIKEALELTLGDFNIETLKTRAREIKNITLIHQEAELLFLLAREYELKGRYREASHVVRHVLDDQFKIASKDYEAMRLIPKALMLLMVCQAKCRNFEKANAAYKKARHFSAIYLQGRYTKAFIHVQKRIAKDPSRLKFSQAYLPVYVQNYDHLPKANTLGALLLKMRRKLGKTKVDVSDGLCDVETFIHLQINRINNRPLLMAALFQRLGIDIHLFGCIILDDVDMLNETMKDKVKQLLTLGDNEKAIKFMNCLESDTDFQSNINHQFLFIHQAKARETEYSPSEQIELAHKGLKMTCDFLGIINADYYIYSIQEVIIMNQLATAYGHSEDMGKAIDIYKKLYQNLNSRLDNDVVKLQMFITVMHNYIKFLGLMHYNTIAIKVAEEVEAFARRTECISNLGQIIFNKAWNIFQIGAHEKSVPFFKEAYGYALHFDSYHQGKHIPMIRDFVKEHLDIDLDATENTL